MKTFVSAPTATAAKIISGTSYGNDASLDIAALLAFWGKNQYPLLALNHKRYQYGLHELPEFQTAWEKEENLFRSLRAEYIIIRDRWAQAGIFSIFIKSGALGLSFPYLSSNLDVLIREEHLEKARTILMESGYIELKHIEEPKKFLFRKFIGEKCVSAIHLHTQVAWEVGFMDEEALWQRSRVSPDDEAAIVPSPEDVILITVAHSFYENKKFRLSDIIQIRECLQKDKVDWEYIERVARQRGWLDGLRFSLLVYAHLEETLWGKTSILPAILANWQSRLKRLLVTNGYYRRIMRRYPVSLPLAIPFFFSKFLYYKKVLCDQRRSLWQRLYDVIRTLAYGVKLKSGIRPQPSFLVSFSGPDGSGKTCHAENLVHVLSQCGIRTRYYWNRTATSRLIRFFSVRVKKHIWSRMEEKPGIMGRQERLRNPFLRVLWSYAVVAETALSYFLHVRIPRLCGWVVVCDRYVFDAVAEMECSLPPDKISRLAVKLMLALVPRPDIAYLLDIPGEVSAQRKNEDTDADYLRRQRRVYTKLARRYHLRVKKTDREFYIVTNEITSEAANYYFDHFDTFLNGLFLSNPGQLNRRKL